jgi:peptide/nickel transport system substrate-binding protein
MKRLLVFALTIGLSIALTLPAKSASDQPKRGGTLTMAIRKDLVLMNPMVATRSTDKSIRELMYDSLLVVDAQGKVQPNLAESWEISKDGKLYTFQLRKGVKFHDGREMTAPDVKFSMDYTLNPRNGAHGLNRLTLVDGVAVDEKYTLKISLKKPAPAFLAFLTDIGSFSVIPKESLETGIAKPSNYPPGTGPFKFVEWKPNQRIVFERFDGYWGQKAYIDRLVLRPIRDSTVRFTALRAGDVDMVERTPYEWVDQLVKGRLKGIKFAEASTGGFRRLVFNVAAPPFNNKKLRQAVAHAINKEEFMNASFLGFGKGADQKYPKGHTWYIEGVPSLGYNIDRAKALLTESGYEGQTINLTISQGNEAQATILQAQLKRIGIKVQVKLLDYGSYVQRWRTGKFNFKFSGASIQPDPWLTYATSLRCEGDPNKRASNESAYCNEKVEALFKKAESELDQEKRRFLFKQILTQVNEDVPDMPIGFVARYYTYRDHVKGFKTDGEGSFRWLGGGLTAAWLDK